MSAALDAMPSMIERIRHDLVGLKMPRALEALDHVVRRLEHGELSALEAIDILLSEELTLRENSRIKTALRMGRLATITIRHPKSPALAENLLAESQCSQTREINGM
nr:y4dK protein - Rhizobium sp. plasmid pNGR234a [Rhizobium sp.]